MALHNITCDECGTAVSLASDADEEVVKAGTGSPGFLGSWSYRKDCPDCGSTVGIQVE